MSHPTSLAGLIVAFVLVAGCGGAEPSDPARQAAATSTPSGSSYDGEQVLDEQLNDVLDSQGGVRWDD